ncbi:MAG: DUF2804 family protein [Rhizobiales bacterium]|nr:DUF2804 family protein [Hyphomicrobiales bacterium]
MQRELGPGDLLDARGHLQEAGFATSEVKRYRRASVGASSLRIKEWDYYCVLSEDHGLALTVADNGYMGLLSATWMDLATPKETTESILIPFPMGRMGLPETADADDIVQTHPRMNMAFRLAPEARHLSMDCPGFGKGKGLKVDVTLSQPAMDRMVIATPFAKAPRAFYYNQKINCMPAEGTVVFDGKSFVFDPATASAVLDWGRGVWTYDNTWYWGSASGHHEGRPFGFNIGYGFGDTSAASENMLFYDGRAHKLEAVTFHIPPEGYDAAPWRFTSNDGRFEMNFAPIIDRAANMNLDLLRSIQHQVFGRFSGSVVLDDGRRLEIADILGFAEEVQNRW